VAKERLTRAQQSAKVDALVKEQFATKTAKEAAKKAAAKTAAPVAEAVVEAAAPVTKTAAKLAQPAITGAVETGGLIPQGTVLGSRLRAAQEAAKKVVAQAAAPVAETAGGAMRNAHGAMEAAMREAAPAIGQATKAASKLGMAAQFLGKIAAPLMFAEQGYNASKLLKQEGRDAAMKRTEDILLAHEKGDQDIEANRTAPEDRDFYDKVGMGAQRAFNAAKTFGKLNLEGMSDPAGVVGTLAAKYMQTGHDIDRANAEDDAYSAQIRGKKEYNAQKKAREAEGDAALKGFNEAMDRTSPYRSKFPVEEVAKEKNPSLGATTEYLSQRQKAADDQRYDRENSTREAAKEEVPLRAVPVEEVNDLFKTATGTPFDPKSALDRKRMAQLNDFLASRKDLDGVSNTKKSLAWYTHLANSKRK
jgi:hypothetical protein